MNEIILASVIFASPHFCLDRALIAENLLREYREEAQAPVMIDNKLALQFYRGPQSWTLTSIEPDGRTCVIAAGSNWDLEKS